MGKIETLDKYIEEATSIIERNDVKAAEDFQDLIIGVYNSEIESLKTGLDNYSGGSICSGRPIDFIGDVKKLKAKLINYQENLESGLYKDILMGKSSAINVNQTAHQTNENNISITFEQTMNNISSLKSEDLSDEDKDILTGKLAKMSATKDKSKRWETAKDILKWIADKSVSVGIAALPYIVELIKQV